jgi:hypothetical protein
MGLKDILGDETCGKEYEIADTNTYPNTEALLYCCKQTICGTKEVFRVQNWMSVSSPLTPPTSLHSEHECGLIATE